MQFLYVVLRWVKLNKSANWMRENKIRKRNVIWKEDETKTKQNKDKIWYDMHAGCRLFNNCCKSSRENQVSTDFGSIYSLQPWKREKEIIRVMWNSSIRSHNQFCWLSRCLVFIFLPSFSLISRHKHIHNQECIWIMTAKIACQISNTTTWFGSARNVYTQCA